ncbi:hypothetical protein ACJW31_07G155700 [Castanea mollissima]
MDKYLIKKPRTQDSSLVQDSSPSSKQSRPRRFRVEWYENRNWLEYSIAKDAAFCFYCYLFGKDGFILWNQVGKLDSHVGGVNSAHNQVVKKSEDLQKEKQHIQTKYRIQLNAIVDCVRFLLFRGLAFRGHDESQGSSDKGNFLELLQFLGDHNESINEVMQNTWKNCKLTHPDIQKDMVNAIAHETSKAIIEDLGNGFFSILVDESRDISVKEQMALVLRYVNKQGIIIERFLGIVHVASTIALSLKCAIESLLCEHNLSLSRLRGQGYDEASNMQGDINGLKTLILKENKSAFYVHCFAHQLQLTLVAVAKNHINIANFFMWLRRDALRDAQFAKIKEDLENGVRRSGQGLNQETNLKRPGDTRWGSYYGTILNLILMFSAVTDVLKIIEKDGLSDQKVEARSIMRSILSFEFVFALHLMKNILGITNELSIALQKKKKNQDIVNAMDLVKVSKQRLQVMRDDEWTSLLTEVSSFCATHEIPILNMDEIFVNFIFDMRNNDLFLELQGVSELAEKLVSTWKHETYPLVYLLVKLTLTLLVATATVERSFSAMKYIKNELRNRMGDQWMNDCLIVYIEKDIVCSIDNETIMQRFQNMKNRRRQL